MTNLLKKILGLAPIRKALEHLFEEWQMNRPIILGPKERLILHPEARLNNFIANTRSGNIKIGAFVFFGKNVSLLTGTHDYRETLFERIKKVPESGRDIIIEDGAWIASNATIIGPCNIGKNSVICAGSVVISDIPEGVIAGGNPAKVIRRISFNNQNGN